MTKATRAELEHEVEIAREACSALEELLLKAETQLKAQMALNERQSDMALHWLGRYNEANHERALAALTISDLQDRVSKLRNDNAVLEEVAERIERERDEAEAMSVGLGQHLDVLIHTLGNVQGLGNSAV